MTNPMNSQERERFLSARAKIVNAADLPLDAFGELIWDAALAARGQDPTIEEAIDLLRELGADLGRFYNPDKGEPPHLEAIERVCADLSNTFLPAREDTERPDERERVVCRLCNGRGHRKVAGAPYSEPCGCENGMVAVRGTGKPRK
jgi:hypothetical protein